MKILVCYNILRNRGSYFRSMNITMHSKGKVLIIDDDRVAQTLLTRILTLEGYEVVSHRSIEEALGTLDHEGYNALVLDLELPGMGGVEFLNQFSNRIDNMAVIILTAHGTLDSAIQAIRYKVSDYLQKPIKRDDVIKSIEKAIAEKKNSPRVSEKDHFSDYSTSNPSELRPYGGVIINFDKRVISDINNTIELTSNESKILRALIRNQHHVISHSALVRAAQGYDVNMVEAAKILRPVICRLRQKLSSIHLGLTWIQNIRGAGYLLEFPTIKAN